MQITMPKWVVSEFLLDHHLKQTNKQPHFPVSFTVLSTSSVRRKNSPCFAGCSLGIVIPKWVELDFGDDNGCYYRQDGFCISVSSFHIFHIHVNLLLCSVRVIVEYG